MDLFKSLPLKKQEYMNRLFRNCTEEVKYYMSVIDVEADQTFIKAGEECKYIYIILSGKVTGVEWPMHEKSYFFKDFGPGDFFGEIECFAGLPRYRISILSSTKCRLLAIPSVYLVKMTVGIEKILIFEVIYRLSTKKMSYQQETHCN